MEFNIFQRDFYKAIHIVQKAISTKNTLPILTGIFLETIKDKGLHLISTDLELGIEYWVKSEVKEEGSIVLPSSYLSNIIRELPDDEINIKINTDKFQAELICLNSNFKINGYDPEEFPNLPEIKVDIKLKIQGNKFKEMIDQVIFAKSSDQTQAALTGVLMFIGNKDIKMVATNTYRLAYTRMPMENDLENDIRVILPGETLNELSQLLDGEEDVEISISSNYVSFNFKDITVISRLIEGQFPNYRQVIPEEFNTRVKVKKDDLLKSVRRVSLISNRNSGVISLKINNNIMEINSVNSEVGSAYEKLMVEVEGPEQNINIDVNYLIDPLKALTVDEIILEFIGPLNPLNLKKVDNEDYTFLIMPIRPGS
jgi:DNA polymerase III subunit beta